MAELLTIGQLADHCGVTVRAIRHYHRIGLLPEPARDNSGYRRYGAHAVVDLVRIRVLADAGVPLARVSELLSAGLGEFADSVSEIDAALQQQIDQLERRRQQLAVLLTGDRLVLPPDVAELLDDLRSMGTSKRGVELERDGWILLGVLCPEVVPGWVSEKRIALADEEFRRLYIRCDEARDWDPSDSRLEELAIWMVEWVRSQQDQVGTGHVQTNAVHPGVMLVEQLMSAESANNSPAWKRLAELSSTLTGHEAGWPSVRGAGSATPRSHGPNAQAG